MSKQIFVKSVKESSLDQMYKEAMTYLENIGFIKTPLLSITSKEENLRCYLFSQGEEKVMLEFRKDNFEQLLRLTFEPLEIKFVYDILLMRFNQIASEREGSVFIYNE